jgi:hypothetical protein
MGVVYKAVDTRLERAGELLVHNNEDSQKYSPHPHFVKRVSEPSGHGLPFI